MLRIALERLCGSFSTSVPLSTPEGATLPALLETLLSRMDRFVELPTDEHRLSYYYGTLAERRGWKERFRSKRMPPGRGARRTCFIESARAFSRGGASGPNLASAGPRTAAAFSEATGGRLAGFRQATRRALLRSCREERDHFLLEAFRPRLERPPRCSGRLDQGLGDRRMVLASTRRQATSRRWLPNLTGDHRSWLIPSTGREVVDPMIQRIQCVSCCWAYTEPPVATETQTARIRRRTFPIPQLGPRDGFLRGITPLGWVVLLGAELGLWEGAAIGTDWSPPPGEDADTRRGLGRA